MKDKVFILEDDAGICGLIRVALEMNGIAFESFSCCADFFVRWRPNGPTWPFWT